MGPPIGYLLQGNLQGFVSRGMSFLSSTFYRINIETEKCFNRIVTP